LNAAFAMAILDLISSFVIMLPEQLKYSTFSNYHSLSVNRHMSYCHAEIDFEPSTSPCSPLACTQTTSTRYLLSPNKSARWNCKNRKSLLDVDPETPRIQAGIVTCSASSSLAKPQTSSEFQDASIIVISVKPFVLWKWNVHFIKVVYRFILGAFAKLRTTISFVVSVSLSAWNNSVPTGRIFLKFAIMVFFENLPKKNWNLIKIWQE
jgi:hypothetical protein